jgi:hypothetical protein
VRDDFAVVDKRSVGALKVGENELYSSFVDSRVKAGHLRIMENNDVFPSSADGDTSLVKGKIFQDLAVMFQNNPCHDDTQLF